MTFKNDLGQEPQEMSTEMEITEAVQKRDSEREFVDRKHEKLLRKKSIILLRPMDSSRIDRIFKIVDEYSDMVAFVIGEGDKQQVVLRYKPIINERLNVKEIIRLGNQAYHQGNYDECIENYLKLLQIFNNPRAIVYSKLGLAYMKKMQIELAINYLTIATELSRVEQVDYDFSDLLAKLRGEIPNSDKKPHFRMKLEDFNYSDVTNYYGLENFSEINAYINESGLNVESACEELGLSPEETDLIKLIYAREFYTQGNYVKGDLFLKSFEKSKNKTDKTREVFKEIKRNRRFYQNRQSDKPLQLSLTLVPNKKIV